MPDFEATVRSALARRLQVARAPSMPVWDDQAVAEIMRAAGPPSGMVTADGPEAASALLSLQQQASEGSAREIRHGELLDELLAGAGPELDRDGSLEQIAVRYVRGLEAQARAAREMLAAFKQGPNGWSARVKAEQVDQWRERLGHDG
jgi:hypothetical protein